MVKEYSVAYKEEETTKRTKRRKRNSLLEQAYLQEPENSGDWKQSKSPLEGKILP